MNKFDDTEHLELERYKACAALNSALDEYLEQATCERLPLTRVLAAAMHMLAQHCSAARIWVRTWDESLQMRDFHWPDASVSDYFETGVLEGAALEDRTVVFVNADGTVISQRIDVAGASFGLAAVHFDVALSNSEMIAAQVLLDTWCEELDNFLAAISRARHKHEITLKLSAALKNPVLDAGIAEAIEVLRSEVAFDDLLLVYLHETDESGSSLNYRIIKNGQLLHDSFQSELRVDEATRRSLLALAKGRDRGLPEQLGMSDYREDVLINGVREEWVVGRLFIASKRGEFNTFDRDLLERFADFIRQRIVDFNREWKVLSQTFSRDAVVRLLSEEDYLSNRLKPCEQDVAVLFCDISGFTRLSEQVLREPALIGELINTWSARVVDILWATGGVFDKMVGDCIIGLWGPPFFEMTPRDACAAAAAAAVDIRDYTQRLSEDLPVLKQADFQFGVATGLHYCPLYVGFFGPNDDYTGFSSGMNNTARLQGVANCNEILCMQKFVDALGTPERFGEQRSANVKNVADAIRFRALVR